MLVLHVAEELNDSDKTVDGTKQSSNHKVSVCRLYNDIIVLAIDHKRLQVYLHQANHVISLAGCRQQQRSKFVTALIQRMSLVLVLMLMTTVRQARWAVLWYLFNLLGQFLKNQGSVHLCPKLTVNS